MLRWSDSISVLNGCDIGSSNDATLTLKIDLLPSNEVALNLEHIQVELLSEEVFDLI